MRPYLVYSYPYSHASAGPKVLHRLCHELNEIGQRAFVAFPETNPEWNTPYRAPTIDPSWIAVYPEIVSGNPWGASTVVRWVLNTPGLLGGDREYDPSEIVFSYHRFFADAPLLTLHAVETDIYFDQGKPRSGAAVYAGKGRATLGVPGAREVTLAMRQDRYALAELLNSVEVLYCFDPVSGMTDVARLCGCPVIVVADQPRPQTGSEVRWDGIGWNEMPEAWDGAALRAWYLEQHDVFLRQLDRFVGMTQVPVPEWWEVASGDLWAVGT